MEFSAIKIQKKDNQSSCLKILMCFGKIVSIEDLLIGFQC